ncbi:MAG TPA: cytochrome P460 family protein [Bacteroidia bacterium]|nr:cytochrome P460 family protein [Bacteroidia bacterium]HNU34231.1 cytochrome P460 family protein [Bacteroidia bacterium]
MKKEKILSLLMLTVIIAVSFNSCKKKDDDDEPTAFDTELYNMAKETSGFVWFKNSSSALPKSSGTGHSQPFLRTRYNAAAATQLDSTGQILTGATFPENSLIVKELLNSSSVLERYAILYKKPSNENADAKGWVWGYINADGSVAEPTSNKGSACTGCHSQSDNIDYMLMKKYFP